MSHLITNRTKIEADEAKLGGKAKNLITLRRLGLPVPAFFVLSTQFYLEALASIQTEIQQKLAMLRSDEVQAVAQTSAELRACIESIQLNGQIQDEIIDTYRRHFAKDRFVAVRSSAIGEDTRAQSFAGQFDSFLFVRGEAELIYAIKKCWASAFSERALTYRYLNHLDVNTIEVAVIVQEMIDGTVSGVTFTANPVSGNEDILVINATYGLGEGIVSGKLDTDTYQITKNSLESIDSTIVSKARQFVFNHALGQGTTEVPVEPQLQSVPCLNSAQIHDLATLALRIEKHYQCPQDIEWTISNGKIFVLQTRPITTLKSKAHRLIWDNSNIIESYAGVTTPLTYTFAREAYASVYRQFCDVCGVSHEKILENEETFENMIGLIKGRIYYNLVNWYRVLSLFPGFHYNKQFMEEMMGVKEKLNYEKEVSPITWQRRYLVEFPQLLKLLWRMLTHLRRSKRLVIEFQQHFNATLAAYRRCELRSLNTNELLDIYDELKRKLLQNWKAPIINDFFAMIFYGVLKKLCVSWIGDKEGTLQNDLLCGEGGVESTEPTKAIVRLAFAVRADPKLATVFEITPVPKLFSRLQNEPSFGPFFSDIEDYLEKYGSRCMNELKLEEKTLKDDPSFLFEMIKTYVKRSDLSIEQLESRERAIRQKAEQVVATQLRLFKRPVFNWVLMRARQHVKHRENLRFARTRIFGLVRELFNAIGQRFYETKQLDDPRDLYFLEVEEIFGIAKGTATSTNLKALIGLRKEEFERYRREPAPPDRFETVGIVWQGNAFEPHTPGAKQSAEASNTLRGVGCCPGVVKGVAKLVTSPQDAQLDGEILVAERTDPGWVPLFPTARGILIERGSLLSHSAIVARELGIPTIVGIKDLTKRIQNGQPIEMDGGRGTVTLLLLD